MLFGHRSFCAFFLACALAPAAKAQSDVPETCPCPAVSAARATTQARVAQVVAAMRELKDLKVACEIRFISVDPALAARCAACPKCEECDAAGRKMRFVTLDDKQLVHIIEAIQRDDRTNVMQAPKLIVENGQTGSIEVSDNSEYVSGFELSAENDSIVTKPKVEKYATGVKVAVLPVVSADRKYVRLAFKTKVTQLDTPEIPLFPITVPVPAMTAGCADGCKMQIQYIQQPKFSSLSLDETVVLADGRTALFDLGRRPNTCPTKTEELLKTVPFIGQMVSFRGLRGESRVMVMVTPRIIADHESSEVAKHVTVAAGDEEESMCCTGEQHEVAVKVPAKQTKLQNLLHSYHKACVEGRNAAATRYAVEALAIDPTCFSHP